MDISKFVKHNSTTILTVSAVAATTAAVIFAARGHSKAQDILEAHRSSDPELDLDWREKIKLTWTSYAPAILAYGAAVASIVYLHKTGERRAASIAAAAAMSENLLRTYISRVEEELGEEKVQEVKDTMAQERINEDSPSDRQIIIGDGKILCRDGFSGRYFESSKNAIDASVNVINRIILDDGYASLSEFYDEIGLDPTTISDHIGWNHDALLRVDTSGVLSADGRPCLELSFRHNPIAGYASFR